MPHAGGRARRRGPPDHRGPGRGRRPAPAAAGVHPPRCVPVRVLHAGPDLLGGGAAGRGRARLAKRRDQRPGSRVGRPRRRRDPRAHERQSLPLRGVREHRRGDPRAGSSVRPFRYELAPDASAAIDLLAGEPEAAFLAGGTNLVDLMKLDVERPDVLVDVTRVVSDRIEELPDAGVRIGAGVLNNDLAVDPVIRRRYPALSQALLSGATYQLRNLATTGGNLLQRTRCVYFQDVTKPCNKRSPGSGCAARDGYHRGLAVLGHSPSCIATHPSDMAVPLAAFDAVVSVEGLAGAREIPLTEFHRLPGDEPDRDTVLERGELIVAVTLPPLPIAARSRYRKVRDRASYAFALVSVAAAVDLDGGVVQDVRIALGGVAHKPWRATRAEEALRGAEATEAALRAAAAAELAAADPLPDLAWKVPMASNTIVATLRSLLGSAR